MTKPVTQHKSVADEYRRIYNEVHNDFKCDNCFYRSRSCDGWRSSPTVCHKILLPEKPRAAQRS